jgi:NhaP-type Na+/H+ or K+/H+ antiporter
LSLAYIYLLYIAYLDGYDFLQNFKLYLGLNEISNLLENKNFLILFWIHFLAINLFSGGWIVKDSQLHHINKFLISLALIITYLTGPIGLFIYWIIRIFYAKRISLYD